MFTTRARQGTRPLVAARTPARASVVPSPCWPPSSSACWHPPLPFPPPSRWCRTRGAQAAPPAPAHSVRVVVTGGMVAWQVTLIALGAALLAAVAAVLLDRVLAVRKAASATA